MDDYQRTRDELARQRREANNERFQRVLIRHMVVLHVTEKAVLVMENEDLAGDARREVWIPKSQASAWDPPLRELDKGDAVQFEIPRWLADEKELHYE